MRGFCFSKSFFQKDNVDLPNRITEHQTQKIRAIRDNPRFRQRMPKTLHTPNDMVYLTTEVGIFFVDKTVFTYSICTYPNQPS